MKTIAKYPIAKLPDDLRGSGLGDAKYVRVVLEPVDEYGERDRDDIFATLDQIGYRFERSGLSESEVAAYVREARGKR